MHTATTSTNGNASGGSFSGDDSGVRRPNATRSLRAPRRMFLCDVPLFAKHPGPNCDENVRLMGTVVDLMDGSPSRPPGVRPTTATDSTRANRLVHFVIDDGTESIGVFAKRRRRNEKEVSGCTERDAAKRSLSKSKENTQIPPPTATTSKNTNQNHLIPVANPPSDNLSSEQFESILRKKSQPRPILLGQTVDCIGRICVDIDKRTGKSMNNDEEKMPRMWVAASSVSIVNNPQAVTLRHIELSSAKRLKGMTGETRRRGSQIGSSILTPQNRILVSGLERRLNPLFRCHRQRSVVFDTDAAFNYIKLSKDDGGITPRELASLVGATEPDETLAVNLAVEQLREDCRIYLNQGKWFPM